MTYRDAIFISTDSHVTEPIELYGERVDAAFRDRVPRIETVGEWRTLLIEGLGPRKLMPASEREVAVVGDFEADDRLRDQLRDGVSAEVIFPTFALQACFASDDAEFQRQLCHAYNSWAADTFDDHRLLAVGMVAMLDIDGAVEDAKAVADQGFRALFLPAQVPSRPYNDAEYDKFWAVAEELGLPLTFHSGTGHEPRVVRGPGGAVVNYLMGAQLDGPMVILTLAAGGALDRFPGSEGRHRRDGRLVAGVDHDPGRRDLRGPQHVRAPEAVDEAERAHPAPVRGHVHVRPGRDQQPRYHRASRRSCGATTTRTPRARGPSRRRCAPISSTASARKISRPSSAATPPPCSASTSINSRPYRGPFPL